MNVKVFIGILFLLNCFFVSSCFAVNITIDQAPTSITSDPFSVTVSVLGASAGQNYLRVDLFKDGSTNYFGNTYNGSDWFDDSVGAHYFPITIADSQTPVTATIQSRLGSPSQGEYTGPGEYKLKIRRYTSSGNPASDDVSPVPIQISYSFPTPSPTATVSPTPTRTPTPTPTKIPAPTSGPTKALTVVDQEVLSSDKEGATIHDDEPTAVLAARDESLTPTPRVSAVPLLTKGATEESGDYVALILCSVGGVLLISCGILVYLNKKKGATL